MRFSFLPVNVLVALLWLSSSVKDTIAAAPHFIAPLSNRSARHLPFVSRGGAARKTAASMPSAADLLDSVASSLGEKFEEAVESGLPTQLTYGFAAGFCSGIALKKAGQVAATILGVGFVSLQTLSFLGYIDVKHDKFKSSVEGALDLNKDGKVDKSDFQQSFDKLMGVLTYNMPSGAGFVGGFLSGVRM